MFIKWTALFLFLPILGFADNCTRLPDDFDDNRIYLKIQAGTESFRFYTDSGGGLYPFVYADIAKKLGMKIEETVAEGDFKFGYSTFPDSIAKQQIPVSKIWKGKVRVFTFDSEGKDEASESRFFLGDGFFGATLFADRIWKFDYPKKELRVCKTLPVLKGFSKIPMHFKVDKHRRTSHQPRIEIEVAGTKIPVLFDTGATSMYSKEAVDSLQLKKPFTASSFIRVSVAERWRKQNPTWKVFKAGERFAGGGDLIEVPEVKIGGVAVGPVWFATRKDEIYDHYSTAIMDARIDGAVGGNLFRYFEMVADYRKATLALKRVKH
jgi:hypothetical protein